MQFEMISVSQFNKEHGKNWDAPAVDYRGEIPGLCIGVTPEIKLKDGTLDVESTTFIRSIEELNDGFWNYHRYDMSYKYEWTGRLVFRGYYISHYDSQEREEYFVEVEKVEEIIEWSNDVFDDQYDIGDY